VQMKELTLNRFAGCNNGGLGTTPMELFQRWVDYWFCFLRLFSFLSRIPIIVALDRIQGVCVDQDPRWRLHKEICWAWGFNHNNIFQISLCS
jgi:hypothetical protein